MQIEEAFVAIQFPGAASNSKNAYNRFNAASLFNWGVAEQAGNGIAAGTQDNSNVYEYNKVTRPFRYLGEQGNDVLNPCQKPLSLVQWLIEIYGKDAACILDLCSGSGSFAMGALRLGKDAIAIDIDQHQVNGMLQRVTKTLDENEDKECAYIDPGDAEDAGNAEEAGEETA